MCPPKTDRQLELKVKSQVSVAQQDEPLGGGNGPNNGQQGLCFRRLSSSGDGKVPFLSQFTLLIDACL